MHFMIAEKSSDVKVKRVSRLTESKARCCISHDFGGFYQIIPCIRPAVVRIKGAHGCLHWTFTSPSNALQIGLEGFGTGITLRQPSERLRANRSLINCPAVPFLLSPSRM